MTSAKAFDERVCALGEGPLWHPERKQLFWFDILGKRLLSRDETGPIEWQFEQHLSAAGWVDRETLLITSETALFRFDIETGESVHLTGLEAENSLTRSNDGRADPAGGFWIGTMGKGAEPKAGAIYRYYHGALERLYGKITIPNSICFSPDGSLAYFTDTPTRRIMRQALDAECWPKGEPEVYVDLNDAGLNPDGSVVDAEGCLWNAQWGASRVARYSPDGEFLSAVEFPAKQVSCPAFGGTALSTLFATSAVEGLTSPLNQEGRTYATDLSVVGQHEHRIVLR